MTFFRFPNGDPYQLKAPLTAVVGYYGLFAATLLGSLIVPPGIFTAQFAHLSGIEAASQILPYMLYNRQLAETAPDLYGKSLMIKAVLLGGSLLPTLVAFVFLLVSTAFIWITKKWKHFAAVAFLMFLFVPTLAALTSTNPSSLPRGNMLYDAVGVSRALLPCFYYLILQFAFVALATIIIRILLPKLLSFGPSDELKARKAEAT